MTAALDPLWQAALAIAESSAPAEVWRRRLAEAVHAAARPHSVIAVCFPHDRPDRYVHTTHPAEHTALTERLARDHVGLLVVTLDWRARFERAGSVFAASQVLGDQRAMRTLMTDVYEPIGVKAVFTAVFTTERRQVLGWLSVQTFESAEERELDLIPPLRQVAAAAAKTIDGAIAAAIALGAPLERRQWLPPAWLRDLSAREREVAALVAYGYSDGNIAALLDISETTIGTHLARVFRKLDVHSRVQLARKLSDPR